MHTCIIICVVGKNVNNITNINAENGIVQIGERCIVHRQGGEDNRDPMEDEEQRMPLQQGYENDAPFSGFA